MDDPSPRNQVCIENLCSHWWSCGAAYIIYLGGLDYGLGKCKILTTPRNLEAFTWVHSCCDDLHSCEYVVSSSEAIPRVHPAMTTRAGKPTSSNVPSSTAARRVTRYAPRAEGTQTCAPCTYVRCRVRRKRRDQDADGREFVQEGGTSNAGGGRRRPCATLACGGVRRVQERMGPGRPEVGFSPLSLSLSLSFISRRTF